MNTRIKPRTRGMIDQHTVCCKIDNTTFEKIEQYKELLEINRNRLINIALKQWLEWNMR